MSRWWSPLQETGNRWLEHKDARLGAALAYYSIFSLGPLIVIDRQRSESKPADIRRARAA
jgi:hypothetical protein